MILNFLILAVCAGITVAAVRFFLVRGLYILGTALQLSAKTRGQVLGYATSTPEFVVVIASALTGAFNAGFWNIASSNIINFILFSSALLFYRQQADLANLRFLDEIVFGLLSVAIPLVLFKYYQPYNFIIKLALNFK